MRISEGITRAVARVRVEWVAALVMLALAYLDLTARSMVVTRLTGLGLDHTEQAALLATGALLALVSRGRDWLFYLATLPLLGHIAIAFVVTAENRGGYHTAVLYAWSVVQMWLLYAWQEGGHHD